MPQSQVCPPLDLRSLQQLFCVSLCLMLSGISTAADEFVPQRCEVLPLADHRTSMRINGVEQLQWHFGPQYPRPFFYPLNGPSGVSLTRMGHPGAENHDHHRSVWFAWRSVNDLDFWSDDSGTSIRQKHWYRYRDGDDEAILAVRLGWYDASGQELMDQDLVAALRPLASDEYTLELQITLRAAEGVETVSLGHTSLGPLAVRVAGSLSEHFGGGRLTSSEGAVGEPQVFGKPARWVDYSGPVVIGQGTGRQVVHEGITFHDHPANPRYPSHWHVRADGWMGAAFCMQEGFQLRADAPLTLRYLLYVHSGRCQPRRADDIHQRFAKRSGFRVYRPEPPRPHLQYEVDRIPSP